MSVFDFNFKRQFLIVSTLTKQGEKLHARRPHRSGSGYRSSAEARIRQMRREILRQSANQENELLRSIPDHDVCSIDIQRKPERYIHMPASSDDQVVSFRDTIFRSTEHSGQCQRKSRLANLRGFCQGPYRSGNQALCGGRLWQNTEANGIRLGLDNNRSVYVSFPVGEVQEYQSSRKTAYVAGTARQLSDRCHYYSRRGSRCQYSGQSVLRGRIFLYHGSRLFGLCQTSYDSPSFRFLRHANKGQFQVQASLFRVRQEGHRSAIRSNDHLDGILFKSCLSRSVTQDRVHRSGNGASARIPYQQFYRPGLDHHTSLPVPVADRIILQMDQTTPAHKDFLWNQRERGEDSNMDSYLRLCSRRHPQKTSSHPSQPLHNITDFKSNAFRENAHFTGLCQTSVANQEDGRSKSVDSKGFLIGQ